MYICSTNLDKMPNNVHFHRIRKSEIYDLARAFTDLETGNHLLCPRSTEEIDAINEVCDLYEKSESLRTERDKEIMFLMRLCTDYEWCVANGYDNLKLDEIITDE